MGNQTPKKKITGMSIVDALNNYIVPPKREPDAPLRLPVSNIYNIKGVGQIICGTVEQGTLRPGDQVGFVPSNLKGKKIFSIEQHKKVLDNAGPGNSVGLSIKGIAKDEKVNPGDIIYNEKDGELKPIKSFTALVSVQEHPGVLKPGYCPVIFSRTAKVACKMTKICGKSERRPEEPRSKILQNFHNTKMRKSNLNRPPHFSSNLLHNAPLWVDSLSWTLIV